MLLVRNRSFRCSLPGSRVLHSLEEQPAVAMGGQPCVPESVSLAGHRSAAHSLPQVLVPADSLDAIPAVTGGLEPAAAAATAPAAPSPQPAPTTPSPSPSPAAPAPTAPTPATGAAAAAAGGSTTISGVALGSGYLANCTVQLVEDGTALQITSTDAEGRFSFDCGADCASLGVRAAGG